MRRALTVVIVALAAVPSAAAHVTITPTRVAPGSDVVLTFVVPNETENDVINGVTIVPPRGFDYEAVEAPSGFTRGPVPARRIVWQRGSIEPGRFLTFGVSGTAPSKAATLVFLVYEHYRSGRVYTYKPSLVVAAPAPTSARDRSSHTLAKAALFVGIAAGAIAVATFFLALAHWLRGPNELRESG
jgi:uncharacterized protein YcnI